MPTWEFNIFNDVNFLNITDTFDYYHWTYLFLYLLKLTAKHGFINRVAEVSCENPRMMYHLWIWLYMGSMATFKPLYPGMGPYNRPILRFKSFSLLSVFTVRSRSFTLSNYWYTGRFLCGELYTDAVVCMCLPPLFIFIFFLSWSPFTIVNDGFYDFVGSKRYTRRFWNQPTVNTDFCPRIFGFMYRSHLYLMHIQCFSRDFFRATYIYIVIKLLSHSWWEFIFSRLLVKVDLTNFIIMLTRN